MGLDLKKGQGINISKQGKLTNLRIGLSWDVGSTGKPFDLDVVAAGVGSNGKLPEEGFFVFYNSQLKKNGKPVSPCGAILHSGDNRTGAGDGDDESIMVNLASLDSRIERIDFLVTIYEARERGQDFGKVTKASAKVYDDSNGKEIAHYNLTEDYSGAMVLHAAQLIKNNGDWEFVAVGHGYPNKDLGDIVPLYLA